MIVSLFGGRWAGEVGLYYSILHVPHATMFHPQAGHVTGDRLWRMPLYGQYTKQIQDRVADISNVGVRGRYAAKIPHTVILE